MFRIVQLWGVDTTIPTAFEWALKLKELIYIVAEPFSSADFQHGPLAMVSEGFPVFAVAPKGGVMDSMLLHCHA